MTKNKNKRIDDRDFSQLREIKFIPNIAPNADGSVLSCFGNTQVICSVCLQDGVPGWMKYQKIPGGWLTAEYSMLPYSTKPRKNRDIARGRLDGRSSEIQRLIGRSLRAVVDLRKLGARTLWIDCDVLQADGGTRTAAISGAALALALAFKKKLSEQILEENPLKRLLSAVSIGVWRQEVLLDLNYLEDSQADADFNLVMDEELNFIELQASGEEATFSEQEFNKMLELGKIGIKHILKKQKELLENKNKIPTKKNPSQQQLSDLIKHYESKKDA